MFIFIGVEDSSMSKVVSLEVPGLVALSVTAHKTPGSIPLIPGVAYVFPNVTFVFPVRFPVGSNISVLK